MTLQQFSAAIKREESQETHQQKNRQNQNRRDGKYRPSLSVKWKCWILHCRLSWRKTWLHTAWQVQSFFSSEQNISWGCRCFRLQSTCEEFTRGLWCDRTAHWTVFKNSNYKLTVKHCVKWQRKRYTNMTNFFMYIFCIIWPKTGE